MLLLLIFIFIERVASRPIISEIPDQEVLVGSNAMFECRVVSDLTPHVMWVKLENNNYTDLQASERLQIVAVSIVCHLEKPLFKTNS